MDKIAKEYRDSVRDWFAAIGFPPKGLTGLIRTRYPKQYQEMVDSKAQEVRWEPLYHEVDNEIDFGPMRGKPRLEKPNRYKSNLKSMLLNLIDIQGDTEWGSVQQQMPWIDQAPDDKTRARLGIIMWQEGRHGVQMCDVLEPFGEDGKYIIKLLLSRNTGDHRIDSFNLHYDDWQDVIHYTFLIDRDGKFQLTMLQHNSYAPLARSMGPMLIEEAFHIGSGFLWLKDLMTKPEADVDKIQRYLNRWYPRGLDMFGVDQDSGGEEGGSRAYNYGFKNMRNQEARQGYIAEVSGLVHKLNQARTVALGQDTDERDRPDNIEKPLYVPSDMFDRNVGNYASQFFDIEGHPLEKADYEAYLKTVLPQADPRGREALSPQTAH